MPSDVLKRAMFQNGQMKADSGITQGFDDMDDMDEDEMMEEVSARRPNSPEILMNNLRGDMRSVDARYQELAEMVGEEAAMDTPPEVLAMLQPQLSQQAMGIGALPQGPGMSAPPQMPPQAGAPMPAPQMPPQGGMPAPQGQMPAPQGFADGGFVAGADYGDPDAYPPASPLQQGGVPGYAHGGIASLSVYAPENGLGVYPPNFNQGIVSNIEDAGRNGDTMVAHITPEQDAYLTMLGGGKTVNPDTGLPEHYLGAQMLSNLGQRAMPYLQAADRFAGNLMNPVLTQPVMSQSRTTLGTFGPKVVEGMELAYPTLTQRIGSVAAPIAEKIAESPTMAKAGAALMSIPGAAYLSNKFGDGNMVPGNKNAPVVPGDPATGWKPPVEQEEAPQATPIDWNKAPPVTPPPAEAPVSEGDKTKKVIQEALAKKTKGERLDEYMTENLPIFEKYMGGDKDYNQAQALFLLADMGVKLASSRKRGESFMGALARSAEGVPSGLSALGAQEEAARRQIKAAALTSGLQTIAAEDKGEQELRKILATNALKGQKQTWDDLGAGMFRVKNENGQVIGYQVDKGVKDEFASNPIVPLKKISENEYAVTSPYAKVSTKPAETVKTEANRKTLESDKIVAMDMVNLLDGVIKDVADVYGPGAWATDVKNNVFVAALPDIIATPDTDFAGKKARVDFARKQLNTAIAKMGDTGNVAVYERKLAEKLAGKDPASFFSDPELAMSTLVGLRTEFANVAFRKSAQLGHTNYDIKLDIPNLGTKNDPIPQDKLGYLKNLAESNPNGQVYVKIGKTVEPVLLNTIK